MNLNTTVRFSLCGLLALWTTSIAIGDEPLVTSTTSFRIPFSIDGQDGQAVPGHAVLFVSVDHRPMEQVQRVPANAADFQFTASADGLYGFAVRMTDLQGNIDPTAGPLVPELQVLVDTQPPELAFQLVEVAPGQVNVSWTADDPQIDAGSLQLEYAEGLDGRWRPIEADLKSAGQATINTQPGAAVSVRGFITDSAGNRGEGTAQIVLTMAAPRKLPATPTKPPAAVSGQSQPTFSIPPAQPLGQSPFMSTPYVPQNTPAPQAVQELQPAFPPPVQPVSTTQPQRLSPQIVNNRVFDISYQLEDVGPSGVSSVELFVTENNGRQWFRYGNDIDLQSPFQVDTQGEGTFGFEIRVRNGIGFSDPPPQPGELPSVVITVDQTAPVIEFPQPQVQASGQSSVLLNWRVSDQNTTSTPVRLEYSASANGPWMPLFDWQMDPGRYQWPLRPGLPPSVHFRILARDAAGNMASAQTAQPVLIDQQRPVARMLGIQPAARRVSYP